MRRLQQEIAWFVRAGELRLLHVTTDATLRGGALDLVMAHEHHADNRGLFLRLDDPMADVGRGWGVRIQRLKEQIAEKTTSLKPVGIHLRPLDEVAVPGQGGRAEFAATLLNVARVLVAPLTNVVVVMAPVRVESPELFVEDMAALIRAPQLGHVRWIVVEADGRALTPLVTGLGERALACSCLVDESAAEDDLAAMGAVNVADLGNSGAGAAATPAPGISKPRPWRAPGAMPDVEPPARIGQSRPVSDRDLVAAGLAPGFVNGGGEAMKRLVLGGALAMRQGKTTDALTLQARAAALCGEMHMPREQVINLHVLGGYLIAASLPDRAREIYARSGEIARSHGLADAEASSELALGMMAMGEGRAAQAAKHYAAAGDLAEVAKVPPLAIECWRMAGQLALDAKLDGSAVECWKRALAVAGELDPAVAKATSAAEVARALAAVCRKRGLRAQADELDRRSIAIEQGTGGSAGGSATSAAPSEQYQCDARAVRKPIAGTLDKSARLSSLKRPPRTGSLVIDAPRDDEGQGSWDGVSHRLRGRIGRWPRRLYPAPEAPAGRSGCCRGHRQSPENGSYPPPRNSPAPHGDASRAHHGAIDHRAQPRVHHPGTARPARA